MYTASGWLVVDRNLLHIAKGHKRKDESEQPDHGMLRTTIPIAKNSFLPGYACACTSEFDASSRRGGTDEGDSSESSFSEVCVDQNMIPNMGQPYELHLSRKSRFHTLEVEPLAGHTFDTCSCSLEEAAVQQLRTHM